MKLKLLTLLYLIKLMAHAGETTLTDSEGKTAYLYTPTDKPVKDKTYWLAIGVHGAGGGGKGGGGIGYWAKEDVIVLGPSFAQPKRDPAAPKADGPPADSYQMNGPVHEAKLKALIAEVGKTWKLHPKVFLHGFSAGAQFVHRFAMKNPELVAGVSAASAGSWSTRGFGEIHATANGIPFAISCGQYDREKSVPSAPLNRLEWMQEFAQALRGAHFDVDARVIPDTGHKATEATMALAAQCFERARALNFSRTVMIAADFNALNPLWSLTSEAEQTPAGRATTAHSFWDAATGVIEKQGTAERTGALRLRVNSVTKIDEWSGTLRSGLLPVHCTEKDISKLTLAFDLSSTSARAVRVSIESFDAKHQRTGGREGLVYPASPNDYQRHVLDLGAMKASGQGEFQSGDPFVQISVTISGVLGWAAGAFHEVCLDNLSYAAPAIYVSPTGNDKYDGSSAEKPLATIPKAIFRAQPGDIILLMDGTFENKWCLADFTRAGKPAAWITLKNHPGQHPVLKSLDWNCIKIGKGSAKAISKDAALAYLEVRGLVVHGNAEEVEAKYKTDVGKPASTTNGNGISVDGRFSTNKPHHIRIADNEVRQCSGGGISVIHGDCVQVENNHAHNNCHWMIYAGSGISVYQPFNFDATTGGHRILVRNNHTHHNYCTQPWVTTGKPSDGNGIIVDDTQNHQNKSTNGIYRGGLLLQGNLSHDNGGSGMHCYASDCIDFVNNTVCNNNNVVDYGQLSVTACGHVRVLNNILVAAKDKPLNRVNGLFHDVLLSHNLFWGGNGTIVTGDNSITADPLFVDAEKADFQLGKKSPARKAGGAWEIAPVMDLQGRARQMDALSLGAIED